MNLKINHLAVWVCIVLMHAFGFIWYGPLFGEKWMKLVQLDPAAMESGSSNAGLWILNSIAIVAQIYAIAWLFTRLKIASGAQGAAIAFMLVFALHQLPLMNSNMFAGDEYVLAWIDGGYSLAWITISGFILGSWRKSS